MKYSIALIAAAATLATAQGLSDLPQCAITCGISNASKTKCGLTDSKCLCADKAFQDTVEACVKKSCSKADGCKAAEYAAKNCGVEVPASMGCGGGTTPPPPPPPPSGGNGGSHPPPPPPPHSGGTSPCYGDYCNGSGSSGAGGSGAAPGYGSGASPVEPPSYGGESSAAAEPTGDCESGSGSDGSYGADPAPTGYDTPTDTAAPVPECPCATGGTGSTGTYGAGGSDAYPAGGESSAAGYPATTADVPCATETAPAEESAPVDTAAPCTTAPAEETAAPAATPCPTSVRPYPPPVGSNAGSPYPAESSAAAVPVYGGENATSTEVPGYTNSGNKMFTFSSLGAGLVAVAMLVAF